MIIAGSTVIGSWASSLAGLESISRPLMTGHARTVTLPAVTGAMSWSVTVVGGWYGLIGPTEHSQEFGSSPNVVQAGVL